MRGATSVSVVWYIYCMYFNPRAHEGRDKEDGKLVVEDVKDFNPRAHEGRDTSARSI